MKSFKVLVCLFVCLLGADVFGQSVRNPKSCVDLYDLELDKCTAACGNEYLCDDPFFLPGVNPNCQHVTSEHPLYPTSCLYADGSERNIGTEFGPIRSLVNPASALEEELTGVQAQHIASHVCETLYFCECLRIQSTSWRCYSGNVAGFSVLNEYTTSLLNCIVIEDPVDPPL
jgi:hypothetical protein